MEELGLVEPEILDESMTRKKLENLISEPYEKCKSYSRRLDRIKNIKEDILGQKDQMENEKCIYKLIKNFKTNKCEKIMFGFYAFLCVTIILGEFFFYLIHQFLKKVIKIINSRMFGILSYFIFFFKFGHWTLYIAYDICINK